MKNNCRSLLILSTFFFASCTSTKPLTSSVRPTEITDLQQLESLAYISLIENGNKSKYNDTLSDKSKLLLTSVLATFNKKLPITGTLQVDDVSIINKLNREIEYLCTSADRQKSISNLQLTPTLDALLEDNDKRFGLITVTTGFTRSKGNYGGEIAKGIGLGLLTLGMYTQTPIKYNSTIYAMIIDSKENNIAFFKKSALADKDPLDELILKKQINSIFEGYFWPKVN